MSADHEVHFSGWRAMMDRLVSISQPMEVMISFSPPSVVIFLIEAGPGRLIGLRILAGGETRKRAITTAWGALATIL